MKLCAAIILVGSAWFAIYANVCKYAVHSQIPAFDV